MLILVYFFIIIYLLVDVNNITTSYISWLQTHVLKCSISLWKEFK